MRFFSHSFNVGRGRMNVANFIPYSNAWLAELIAAN
jgi:hypothetical protein